MAKPAACPAPVAIDPNSDIGWIGNPSAQRASSNLLIWARHQRVPAATKRVQNISGLPQRAIGDPAAAGACDQPMARVVGRQRPLWLGLSDEPKCQVPNEMRTHGSQAVRYNYVDALRGSFRYGHRPAGTGLW